MNLAALLLFMMGGCGAEVFVGEAGAPVEMEMLYFDEESRTIPVREGGEVALIKPPQGGKVLLLGIRARNLETGVYQITGALRDKCTGQIVTVEARPIRLIDAGNGWAEAANPASLSAYSNLAACPNAALTRNINGSTYEAVVELAVGDERIQIVSEVIPVCGEAEFEDECLCECSKGYVLGQNCSEFIATESETEC